MSMYGIAILPLMDLVNEGVLPKWYADNCNVAGSIRSLRNLFGKMELHGPASLDKAKDLFKVEYVELVEDNVYWGPLLEHPRSVTFSSHLNSLFAQKLCKNLRHMRKSHHRMCIRPFKKVFNPNSPSCHDQHLT